MRLFLLVTLLLPLVASDAISSEKWISGSYVNVRESPAKDAPIVEKLPINTVVNFTEKTGNICQINWSSTATGFIACEYLSDKKLSYSDVSSQKLPDGTDNPDYSEQRMFWLKPTFDQLSAVANLYEETLVSEHTRRKEHDYVVKGQGIPPSLKRPAIQEFTAMKTLMAKGVVAPKELWSAPNSWKNIRNEIAKLVFPHPDSTAFALELPVIDVLHQWIFRQIELPKIKPSYFRELADIASPKSSAETISAQFQIPWKLNITTLSNWAGDSNSGPVRNGVWDIGDYEQSLMLEINAIGINAKGEVIVEKTVARYAGVAGGDHNSCTGSAHFERPTPGQKIDFPSKEDPIYLFRTLKPFPFLNASVVVKPKILIQPKSLGEDPKFIRASTTFVDFDKDGIDDLAIWHGINTQVGLGDNFEYHLLLIFVNVGGKWHLLDYDEDDPPCGC